MADPEPRQMSRPGNSYAIHRSEHDRYVVARADG
jgi:hypothetical protein